MKGKGFFFFLAFKLVYIWVNRIPAYKHFKPLLRFLFFFFLYFVIHWNETAMGLHVFPILIPPPTSLSTRSP